MWRTRVGYAGGTSASPTYESIGDHVECVEVSYDPNVVSYEELLGVFWDAHDPAARPYANQYSSVVLTTDEAQLGVARRSATTYERESGTIVNTRLERLDRFYPAEDYHQKYYLRQDPTLARAFNAMFGTDQEAIRDSTAAARVNGYLEGHGSVAQLASEIGRLGLDDASAAYLSKRVADGASAAGCAIPSATQ